MGKIWSFVFISEVASVDANLTSQEQFFVDWSRIPDCKYKVSFVFTSTTPAAELTNANVANVFVDLGQGSNTTIVSGMNPRVFGSSFLGFVTPKTLILDVVVPVYSAYLSADNTTNNPIYLLGRPRNNNVQVQILQGITNADDNGVFYAPFSGAYTMVINLEEV